jgi:hypothetical protein
MMHLGRAPEIGKREKTGGRRCGLLTTSVSEIYGVCTVVLRRAIYAAWRRVRFGKKGKTREEV